MIFFRGIYPTAEADIQKDTDIHPPHSQVPESVFCPKAALPRTLELRLNHVSCL